MEIKLEEVQEWFASKSNKEVDELDMYDMFCAKVAYDYACEKLLDVGRSEQLLAFACMDDNQQCKEQCKRCKFVEDGLKSQ